MKHSPNSKRIKAELKARKISQVFIAQMLKVHPVCVNEVIVGKRKNPRIRAAIALAIGEQVTELWLETEKGQKNASAPENRFNPVVGDVARTSDPIRG